MLKIKTPDRCCGINKTSLLHIIVFLHALKTKCAFCKINTFIQQGCMKIVKIENLNYTYFKCLHLKFKICISNKGCYFKLSIH